MKKCVVTIAVGKPYYLKLAENLLRSFLLWNAENDICFLLLTDAPGYYKVYTGKSKIIIEQIHLSEDDKSFTSKFKLFDHAIADENLFVDCDCIVYSDISFVFDAFTGRNFAAIGNSISEGDFFCKVDETVKRFGLTSMPKFVGCIYYFKKNKIVEEIFRKAIEFKNDYDALGFVRLNGKENEEPLLSVAMALNGERAIPNDGTIKADMMYYGKLSSDVLSGHAYLTEPVSSITNGESIPLEASPAIVHFNGPFTYRHNYAIEVYRLEHSTGNQFLVQFVAWMLFTLPDWLKRTIKNTFRSIYRRLFGYRKITINERGE